MIVIDGPVWFVGALVICGLHALYLRAWRHERRADLAWWKRYDARSQQQHEEFMQAIARDNVQVGWNLDGNRERGQA